MNRATPVAMEAFDYDRAFSRNLGWITEWEQQALREKRIAIAGMGGAGGVHLTTLARLGIGSFHVADFDTFELHNFNRQVGAFMGTLGRPKTTVMIETATQINPELDIVPFTEGITCDNLDSFLLGVDLFIDGFDFFELEMRRKVFAACAERAIPAITAAPIGMGASYIVFMPGGMTFEEYFRLDGLSPERQYVKLALGLTPKGFHRNYLVDPSRIDLKRHQSASTGAACQICAGVTAVEGAKILLGRGRVRAAPYYHQFDPYRGRWAQKRLIGGNAHPLQRLKCAIGYRAFAAMSANARPPEDGVAAQSLERILDLGRWAPSGDNAQPWRFTVVDHETVDITVTTEPGNVYDFNHGQPTLIAAGGLLETLRIAATDQGRGMRWAITAHTDTSVRLRASFPAEVGRFRDPLLPYLKVRSVSRLPYRATPLTSAHKETLEACIDDILEIRWFETPQARMSVARLNALATDIRLRIREAYEVHRRIVDWREAFSRTGVPAGAIGLSAPTLALMRWGMGAFWRLNLLNRLFGTAIARREMDIRPGRAAAAHFALALKDGIELDTRTLLRAGQSVQRLWLALTRLGLVMQPGLAPLCFAHYGRNDIAFTGAAPARAAARTLSERLSEIWPGQSDAILFMGRLGWPRRRRQGPRSIRRALAALVEKTEPVVETAPAHSGETTEKVRVNAP